jgi:hypothetical protein
MARTKQTARKPEVTPVGKKTVVDPPKKTESTEPQKAKASYEISTPVKKRRKEANLSKITESKDEISLEKKGDDRIDDLGDFVIPAE